MDGSTVHSPARAPMIVELKTSPQLFWISQTVKLGVRFGIRFLFSRVGAMTGYTRHSSLWLLVIGYWFLGLVFSSRGPIRPLSNPLLSIFFLWHTMSSARPYRTQEAQCVTEKPSIEKPSRIDISHLSTSAIIDSCTLPTTRRAIIMSTSVKRVRNTCSLHPNIVS